MHDLMALMSTLVQRKLRLSEPGDLPSNAPISADANLSSDDMRVECVLERLEQERNVRRTFSGGGWARQASKRESE